MRLELYKISDQTQNPCFYTMLFIPEAYEKNPLWLGVIDTKATDCLWFDVDEKPRNFPTEGQLKTYLQIYGMDSYSTLEICNRDYPPFIFLSLSPWAVDNNWHIDVIDKIPGVNFVKNPDGDIYLTQKEARWGKIKILPNRDMSRDAWDVFVKEQGWQVG